MKGKWLLYPGGRKSGEKEMNFHEDNIIGESKNP